MAQMAQGWKRGVLVSKLREVSNMKSSKWLLLLALMVQYLLCCPSLLIANEMSPAKKQLINEYLQLSGQGNLDLMVSNIQSQVTRAVMFDLQKRFVITSPVTEQRVNEFVGQFYKKLLPKLKVLVIESINRNFSESELKSINKFYMSPLGKKYIEKNPIFYSEFTQFFYIHNKKLMNQLKESVKTVVKDDLVGCPIFRE